MLAAAPKKLAGAHKKLTGEIDKTEKLVAGGKKQVTAFQTTAEGFFATWQSQLESISTESIRAASERRLQAAQQGFQGMSDNLTTAREIYDPIIASLKEQTTLLNQDLSGETIEMLKADAAPGLHTQAEELFATIEAALNKESARAQEVNQILEEESAEVDMEGTEAMAGGEDMDGEEDVEGE